MDATIGNPEYYSTCKAMFVCGSPLTSDKGMDGLLVSNFERARALLKEAKLRRHADRADAASTDLQVLTNLAPVAKSLMERAGFGSSAPTICSSRRRLRAHRSSRASRARK